MKYNIIKELYKTMLCKHKSNIRHDTELYSPNPINEKQIDEYVNGFH